MKEKQVLVVVESPYAGNVERNLEYVRRCMADCFARGEYPFASHALYTQPGVLDDKVPAQRKLGMEAGFAFGELCAKRVVYTDYGWSSGMEEGVRRGRLIGQEIELREIGTNP